MATGNINSNVRRWESGGTIVIDDGTDQKTVLNVVSGSLSWSDPQVSKIKYKDRGVPQMPLEGDDNYGMIKLSCQCGAYVSGLIAMLKGRSAAANTAKPFGVEIKIHAYQSATTGESLTWANTKCFVDADFEVKAGGPDALDTFDVTFGTLVGPTVAAY